MYRSLIFYSKNKCYNIKFNMCSMFSNLLISNIIYKSYFKFLTLVNKVWTCSLSPENWKSKHSKGALYKYTQCAQPPLSSQYKYTKCSQTCLINYWRQTTVNFKVKIIAGEGRRPWATTIFPFVPHISWGGSRFLKREGQTPNKTGMFGSTEQKLWRN